MQDASIFSIPVNSPTISLVTTIPVNTSALKRVQGVSTGDRGQELKLGYCLGVKVIEDRESGF